MTTLPRRLAAPAPGWTAQVDVVVVGSGIAGLTTALRLADAMVVDGAVADAASPDRARKAKVMVVTKDVITAGSTRWAQGGIAAALGADDTPAEHRLDTLVAGAGACDPDAVQVLVEEGPAAVRDLVELGTRFDHTPAGELSLTREGGHHRDRIAHAGGDATGAEIQRALVARLYADPAIELVEHAVVLDLLRAEDGGVAGVTLHVMGEGQRDGVGAVHARAVVIATGGIGQVYASTTNPSVSTGDGVAAALRAGAVVRDLEFVQFHPTVLYVGHRAHGQQPLVSEAVRGEGAFLVDDDGHRFMTGQHPMADLAPRDVVAKAILRSMQTSARPHVWLDARAFGREKWRVRFPTILATLEAHGIDPVRELIPVVPASHYASGGIRTDLFGRSTVARLYACGEAACTGVHGANRLASNSLLEGLVFGRRIAADLTRVLGIAAPTPTPVPATAAPGLIDESARDGLQPLMSGDVGVLRDAAGLARATKGLAELGATRGHEPGIGSWEATNLVTVAAALVAAATRREETRGSHWREDFPERDDEHWLGHLDSVLGPDGSLVTTYVEPTAAARAAAPVTTRGVSVISESALLALRDVGLDPEMVADIVARALDEDLGDGPDVTATATISSAILGRADAVPRKPGVIAGLAVAAYVFEVVGTGRLRADLLVADGERVDAGQPVLAVHGPVRDIVTGERTALNLLGHLSGIATATRAWVDAVAGTGAVVRDTRKTTPGLRALEKYAVRCGGGTNHRMSLSDAALVKDNHVAAAGGVAAAFNLVREHSPGLPIEVEVDTVEECREAVDAGAELVLLDNMADDDRGLGDMRVCVEYARAGGARTEASGGLSIDRARAVAETGVTFIAVGALTHSSPVLDIGLDLVGP